MNTIKAEVNKIILALTSVGIGISLIFPVSLSAHHFRYGTMSWELVDNDTIRLKMQNGWSANHTDFRVEGDYSTWVPGHIGSIKNNYITLNWSGGSPSSQTVDIKIISRDNFTRGGGLAIALLVAATSASIALFRKWETTLPQHGQLE